MADMSKRTSRAAREAEIHLAVSRYLYEEISLAKAAEIGRVSWPQMRTILIEKGIAPRLGVETIEEAERETQVLRDFFSRR